MEGAIPTWSFYRLLEFEHCEYNAFLRYDRKVAEPEEKKNAPAMVRGRTVHDECEQYIRGERDTLTDDKKVLKNADKFKFDEYRELYAEDPSRFAMEEEWGFDREWQTCEYYGETVWCRVKVDRLFWIDPDHTAAEITDYKTGKKFGNEVKHSQQMQLYAVAAFARYPELQSAKVRLEYLDEGKVTTRSYTREQVGFFFTNYTKRAERMTTATRFQPKPNSVNCRFCPFGPNNGGNSACEYGVEV